MAKKKKMERERKKPSWTSNGAGNYLEAGMFTAQRRRIVLGRKKTRAAEQAAEPVRQVEAGKRFQGQGRLSSRLLYPSSLKITIIERDRSSHKERAREREGYRGR